MPDHIKPIAIIVAIAENNAIGKENRLLWHIGDDLKRFRKITTGHTVIMGKKTYESLPLRPLPSRVNIVLSDDPSDNYEGCVMVRSVGEVMDHCRADQENFIIGGGSVYRQFLPLARRLYVTRVHAIFDADTFFPDIPLDVWQITEYEHHCKPDDGDYSYSFINYQRK
jgi:dihydrofolate reductase